MTKPNAVIAVDTFASARAAIAAVANLVGEDRIADAEAILASDRLPIDAAFLDSAPKMRAIALASVGYDNVDLAECTRRKIPVSNVRGSLNEAVADIGHALILCAMRGIVTGWNWAKEGRWIERGPAPFGVDLEYKTLGIVGLGGIGRALAKRALASGMRVIYNNRTPRRDDDATSATYVGFEELLRQADCVVAVVPLGPQTRHMFGAQQFAAMKSTAYFVNIARGGLVDTNALVEALESKQIAGAALDVTEPEPLAPNHPLYQLPNVTITPHIGSATLETRERMALLAARNLIEGLAGRPLPCCLNPTANFQG